MILQFSSSNFTEDSGTYYSPEFMIENSDDLVVIQVTLDVAGSFLIQQSFDKILWLDLPETTVTCSTTGIQTYSECHPELLYRIKTTQEPVSAKIAL